MRILLTADPEIPVPPLLYGGIERIVAGLVSSLKERGHVVGLAAHPASAASVDYFMPWPGGHSHVKQDTLRNMLALKRAAREFVPDVIHSFSRLCYFGLILASNIPKVMSFQREPSSRTVSWANRLSRRTLRFTGCSEYICRLGRLGGGEWTAIHNFVDVDQFTFVPSVPFDAPLVFLSRVESIKGPHRAIEAAKRAGRRLIIAGNHSATPNEAQYWEERVKPQIDGRLIQYVGPVNDKEKNKLLGEAAALIVPIQWDEPFGIVFTEALACGTPVISSPRGALPEIVARDRTGYLVETMPELTDAIWKIDELDRGDCRQAVLNRFSSTAVTKSYLTCYMRGIERRMQSAC